MAHLWNTWRVENGLEDLRVLQCNGHKASLCNKEAKDEWRALWHKSITQRWFYFKQSKKSREEFARVAEDLESPSAQELRTLCGSAQKWIGYAEAEEPFVFF